MGYIYHWAGPQSLFILFIFRWGKSQPENERERARIGKMLVYRQQHRIAVSTWERVNDTPLRSEGGTQVSASSLPQGQWRSDAYETRQRRISGVVCATGATVTMSTIFLPCLSSPFMHCNTKRTRGSGHAGRYKGRPRRVSAEACVVLVGM